MIYDINTKNRSFLEMSQSLRKNGVKNNKFMLALYDESLSGVDVYDPTLTTMQKAKIYAECCSNYWYFLREVCKVVQEGNPDGTHFKLNLASTAMCFCNWQNLNSITIIPRQQGKTIAEVAFSVWVFCFSGSNIKETYLHKNASGSTDNLKRIKAMKELLPKWLIAIVSDRNDKDNIEEKYIAKKNNTIIATASASNDVAADKLGRGSSTALVYFDEFAFLERNDIIMKALSPAWMTSARVAASNNAPYSIRITTTPNNMSLKQSQFCYKVVADAYKFSFELYDVPYAQLHDFVHKNSGNNYVYITYTWQELGLDKEWYEDQIRGMQGDLLTVKRELDLVWPESDEGNIFTEAQLDKIKHFCRPPSSSIMLDGYKIDWFEKMDPMMNYIVSCDVSGGLTQDRSVINIINPSTFHVAGLFYNAQIDTEDFKKLIYDLVTQYLFHAVINIENNSYGLNLLDALMKIPSLEPRLYRERLERQAEQTLSEGHIVKRKTMKIVYGTSTNTKSRPLMYEMLPAIVDYEPEAFVSPAFYEELKNLVRNPRTGKIEARVGMHDDIIMSYLITRYSLQYGKCFQERFGISKVPCPANATGTNAISNGLAHFGNLIDSANIAAYGAEMSYGNQAASIAYDMMRKDAELGFDRPTEAQKKSSIYDTILGFNNDWDI